MFTRATIGFILASTIGQGAGGTPALADDLPPIEAFLMDEGREIALARSAAPAKVSDHATIMVLTRSGYATRREGTNGFVCLVLRSWGNPAYDPKYAYEPGIIVPECLTPDAVETILPLQLYRAELGVRQTPAELIRDKVREKFRSGEFTRTTTVSFSYMLSTAMTLADGSSLTPHVMIYLPDRYDNSQVGGLTYGDQILIVEGGADEPFVAANVYREGIAPVFPD